MMKIAIFLVFIFAIYCFRNYWWRILKARWRGTETDAYVSRIEKEVRSAGGESYPMCFYYVIFQTQDNPQNEARLLNPIRRLETGSRIRVKYLPEKADYAVLSGVIRI